VKWHLLGVRRKVVGRVACRSFTRALNAELDKRGVANVNFVCRGGCYECHIHTLHIVIVFIMTVGWWPYPHASRMGVVSLYCTRITIIDYYSAIGFVHLLISSLSSYFFPPSLYTSGFKLFQCSSDSVLANGSL
jgi:hypothetical protein